MHPTKREKQWWQ